MSPEQNDRALARAVGRVMEEAAFIFTALAPADQGWSGSVAHAVMEFEGPSRGRLDLMTTTTLGRQIAANMLGQEPGEEASSQDGLDALGEILNIVGGVLLGELFGPAALYRLGAPRVRCVAAAPATPRGAARSVSLVAEEGDRIDAALFIDGTAPSHPRLG